MMAMTIDDRIAAVRKQHHGGVCGCDDIDRAHMCVLADEVDRLRDVLRRIAEDADSNGRMTDGRTPYEQCPTAWDYARQTLNQQ